MYWFVMYIFVFICGLEIKDEEKNKARKMSVIVYGNQIARPNLL